ncbi:MAG: HNH endonuclease [Nocardioidaceae bacterium]|nr:HNH endonuclease [Nocardioidaceae bacterium]
MPESISPDDFVRLLASIGPTLGKHRIGGSQSYLAPQWCDAHHVIEWSQGGETSLANCVLLCGFHHRLIHKRHWAIEMAADGHPDFLPPAWIDPARRPRRQRRREPRRT